MTLSLRPIFDPDEIYTLYPLLKEMPETSDHPSTLLAKTLQGVYTCIGFYDNDTFEGFFIFRRLTVDHMFIAGINLRRGIKKYQDLFWEELKTSGIKRVTAQSALPEDMFESFSGMTKKYSVYERNL